MAGRKSYSVTDVAGAIAAARGFAAETGLDENSTTRLAVVIEELVANLIEHGGAEQCELELASSGDAVALTLTDSCAPFDPRATAAADPNPERGGGVGLQLVRGWAEILSYTRIGGHNRLELRLRPPTEEHR